MSLVIDTNVSSLNTQNNLAKSQGALAVATRRLSSGLRINSAADNAGVFSIVQRYTTQIGGLAQASANASDAINLAQTTSSALDQVTANLQAVRDLAAQSANGTYTDADRATIDNEVQQRLAEVTRIANQTTFNGKRVLDGSLQSQSFQIGANVGQTVSVSLGQSVKASDLGSIAEVKTGDISSSLGALSGGVDVAAGGLTIAVGAGPAVAVAEGHYDDVAAFADAINSNTYGRGTRKKKNALLREAGSRRVRDVVAGGVKQPLLGHQPPERRLESVEGGDRHEFALCLQVEGAVGRRCGPGAARRAVPRLGLLPEDAGEMGEEGQLLAHQRAVDAVLARDLGEQAAQLGGALHRGAGGVRCHERAQPLERHLGGGHAERGAGAQQQAGALGLELGARDHLGLHVAEPGEHGVDVAGADRGALREDVAEQATGRVDLAVEMDQQLGFQHAAHALISL